MVSVRQPAQTTHIGHPSFLSARYHTALVFASFLLFSLSSLSLSLSRTSFGSFLTTNDLTNLTNHFFPHSVIAACLPDISVQGSDSDHTQGHTHSIRVSREVVESKRKAERSRRSKSQPLGLHMQCVRPLHTHIVSQRFLAAPAPTSPSRFASCIHPSLLTTPHPAVRSRCHPASAFMT